MRPWLRVLTGVAVFYGCFVMFAFAVTTGHELAHAAAWESNPPRFAFYSDQDAAAEDLVSYETVRVSGRATMVPVVDQTTVALYPGNILVAALTLGLLPADLMPDPVMGSTFYELDAQEQRSLARGETTVEPHHVAMPMVLNAVLAVPVWIWMLWRRSAPSFAAAWANALEWGFNVHHAEAIGWNTAVYMGAAITWLAITGAVILGFVLAKIDALRDGVIFERWREPSLTPDDV